MRRAQSGGGGTSARLGLAAALLLLGCGGESRSGAAERPAPVAKPVAQPAAAGPAPTLALAEPADTDLFVMPQPFPGWHVASDADDHSDDPGPVDMGHGVVFAAVTSAPTRPVPRIDTLLFRAAPDPAAPLVGAFVTALPARGGWYYAVWAPEPLRANDMEYGYEERGLPFDSVDASGRWRRGILGVTARGEARRGWAALRDSVFEAVTWRDRFADMPIYFLDFDGAAFHAAPDGPVMTRPRVLADSGFDVTAMELRGAWMRVKVEHPGESCAELPPNRKTDYYWIRAFDERGRPRVFYPTRGC